MSQETQDQQFANIINEITGKVSKLMLDEFMKIPKELQIGFVLIKSSQLLLANVICQVADSKDELEQLAEIQGPELKELVLNCAASGYAHKFEAHKH